MKKKIHEMGLIYDNKIKEHLKKNLGSDYSSFPKQRIQDEIEKLTNDLLDQHCANVELQNKDYFEQKAKELLERRRHDPVSLASANLLFKSLNIDMESYLKKMQIKESAGPILPEKQKQVPIAS